MTPPMTLGFADWEPLVEELFRSRPGDPFWRGFALATLLATARPDPPIKDQVARTAIEYRHRTKVQTALATLRAKLLELGANESDVARVVCFVVVKSALDNTRLLPAVLAVLEDPLGVWQGVHAVLEAEIAGGRDAVARAGLT